MSMTSEDVLNIADISVSLLRSMLRDFLLHGSISSAKWDAVIELLKIVDSAQKEQG